MVASILGLSARQSEEWKVVSERQPDKDEWEALIFAWKVVSLLRSNAIAITGKDQVYGLGAGQTSRFDSTHLAIWKAQRFGHNLKGAVCASDGFFPFRDSVEELNKYGINAIIEPGGSKADNEVIEACNDYEIALVFQGFVISGIDFYLTERMAKKLYH